MGGARVGRGRWSGQGLIQGSNFGVLRGKVLVIVHTEREDKIHILSMREADKDEQLLFFRNL